MAEKCPAREIFYESLGANKPSEPVIDYGKLREGEFVESIREQVR